VSALLRRVTAVLVDYSPGLILGAGVVALFQVPHRAVAALVFLLALVAAYLASWVTNPHTTEAQS
jgi:hypothetical protein